MTIWILLLGLFTLAFGLLFVFTPRTLIKMSEGLNKMIQGVDTQVMDNRKVVGAILLLLSLFLFYYAYEMGVR